MFVLGPSDVNRYEGDAGNNTDADEEEQASQAHDGSTQNVKNSGHSIKECKDWTAYFRPAKYNNGKPNAMASDVSEAKAVL
jgi:hypothetical protein